MTARALSALSGRRGLMRVRMTAGALRFPVRVVDVKQAYGCTRYLVAPVAGEGEAWVDAERVELEGVGS